MSSRTPISVVRLISAAIGLTLLPVLASRPTIAASEARSAGARSTGSICTGAIRHPLTVHIEGLDPVRRGAPVRLRVTTTTLRRIDRGDVRLVSSGGAAVIGSSRADLRAVPAGGHAASDFTVAVPEQGHRFLIQFRIQGEGTGGRSAVGAAYNLLPDGRSERLRQASTATGDKVLEATAKRIGR